MGSRSPTRFDVALRCILGSCFAVACGGTSPVPRASASREGAISPECGDAASCAAECEAGKRESCYFAGVQYEAGNRTTQSYAEAARLYEAACTAGEPRGCNNLGVIREIGLGVGQDYAAAAELYRRACDGGDGQGCSNLALRYAEGVGVERDPARARQLTDRACSLGNAAACRENE
jgi:TPR repeat protein